MRSGSTSNGPSSPWGSAWYHEHGRMMPADWAEQLAGFEAVLLGAIGDPSVPDHVSLWGSILELRQRLDLWANLRPVPAAARDPWAARRSRARTTSTSSSSARTPKASTRAWAAARIGACPARSGSRCRSSRGPAASASLRLAFECAAQRRGLLTSATKSNASRYGYVLWDEVAAEVAAEFPVVRYERVLVDALAARMVRSPDSLDVVVASNLFADILTDLGAAIQGGMGMAASANIAPGRPSPIGIFEPVHGSAPDIAGQGIANPAGAIWSAVLMLEHLGEADAAARLLGALETTCRDGPRTRDVGGTATTREVGDAVAALRSTG